MFGRFAEEIGKDQVIISAKYTPLTHYKRNCVRKSLEKDLADFRRSYVDIYWLHLPTDIEQHLAEIIELYKEGKICNIGVSNFTLKNAGCQNKSLTRQGYRCTVCRIITA